MFFLTTGRNLKQYIERWAHRGSSSDVFNITKIFLCCLLLLAMVEAYVRPRHLLESLL